MHSAFDRCQACSSLVYNSQLELCEHHVCKNCISVEFKKAKNKGRINENLKCPIQGCEISTQDLQKNLKNDEFEEYLDFCLQEFIEIDNARIINCPKEDCKCKMEKLTASENEINYLHSEESVITQRGEDNRLLSRTGWVHFNLHRIRCPSCGDNFCSECGKSPYHLGLTCEQYEEFLTSRKCRFCEEPLNVNNCAPISSFKALLNCCDSKECLEKRELACTETLECGHFCGGVSNEKECLPCMEPECIERNKMSLSVVPLQTKSDFCAICWVDTIGGEPSILLKCGHTLHYRCVSKVFKDRWNSPHIGFAFSLCPLCKVPIEHNLLGSSVTEIKELKKKVLSLGINSLTSDDKQEISNPNSAFYNDSDNYILSKLSFYLCSSCQEPFFGGKLECNNLLNNEAPSINPEDLCCKKCTHKIAVCDNDSHHDYWTYKCRYCCSKAVWFCFGTHHFCDPCHNRAGELRYKTSKDVPQCGGPQNCPLKIKHPPNGEEFMIGCELCQEIYERSPEETKRILESEKRRKFVDKVLGYVLPLLMITLGIYLLIIIYNLLTWNFFANVFYVAVNISKFLPICLTFVIVINLSVNRLSFAKMTIILVSQLLLIVDILRFIPEIDDIFSKFGIINIFTIFVTLFLEAIYLIRILCFYSIPVVLIIRKRSNRFIFFVVCLFVNILNFFYPFSSYETAIEGGLMLFRYIVVYSLISLLLSLFLYKLNIIHVRIPKTEVAIKIVLATLIITEAITYNLDEYKSLCWHFLFIFRLTLIMAVPVLLFFWTDKQIYIRRKFTPALLTLIFLLITDAIISYYSVTWTFMFNHFARFFMKPLI